MKKNQDTITCMAFFFLTDQFEEQEFQKTRECGNKYACSFSAELMLILIFCCLCQLFSF